ncbi:MAG: putative DNA modification/repair radical SAM protein [Acidobacteriaceae bacterium]|nr:putative DNA modification/repair radical SAM protein [Acidobacteriaceae bacterium]
MDLQGKLRILADAAKYDASCASSGSRRARVEGGLGNTDSMGICHSYTPDGRCVSLLKLLLTNYCIYDCSYCVNRISSDIRRARFSPEEIVFLTVEFYKRNYIEGLFLSSGIIQSPDYTMEQLIEVAKRLRLEHKFGGYIHLKAVPGASKELMRQAGQWADRLSANIELARESDLLQLAPAKNHSEIENSMRQIADGILEAKDNTTRSGKKPKFAPAGQSTQFIVGATNDCDADLLKKSTVLYKSYGLRRAYYSAFSPIPHADPTLPLKKIPLVREHRLYQADWLMRFYGFAADELTTPEEGNLPLEKDPKLAWALRHREFFPVDVNKAGKAALLRVPGFGVRNVARILKIRRYRALTIADLAKLKVSIRKSQFFVLTADSNDSAREIDSLKLPTRLPQVSEQLALFQAADTARTGEL